MLLRCHSSSQVLTNRERRRFESNSYPAGDLFLTQTLLPPSGSRRSPMPFSKKPRDNNHGSHYPGTAWLPGRTLDSLFASPLHPLQHQSVNPSLSWLEKVSLASRSKGTLFGQLNVRHAFNMTRGTSNDRSLIDTDEITIVQNPIRLRPVFVYPSTLGYFLWSQLQLTITRYL
jgi:hypothetical protein